MELSLSLDKVIKSAFNRLRSIYSHYDEGILNYIDDIAKDARKLSNIWLDIWKSVLTDGIELINIDFDYHFKKFNTKYKDKLKRNLNWLYNYYDVGHFYNIEPYHRLAVFYMELSKVIGGKVGSDFHNQFHFHLSSLLKKRDITKKAFEKIVQLFNNSVFINEDNRITKFKNVSQMIEALDKEAATLEVLVKNYRAKL